MPSGKQWTLINVLRVALLQLLDPPGGDPELGGIGSGPPGQMGPPGGFGASFGQPGGMGTETTAVMGYPDLNPSTSGYNPSIGGYNPSTGDYNPQPVPKPRSIPPNEPSTRSSDLSPEQLERVTKLCKFAISSLDYEDKNGAIDNLTRALNLLKTGKKT